MEKLAGDSGSKRSMLIVRQFIVAILSDGRVIGGQIEGKYTAEDLLQRGITYQVGKDGVIDTLDQ